MPEHPDFISSAEIGKILGLGRAAVTRLLHSGKIPALDIGTGPIRSRFRVRRKDFEKFLDEARVRRPDEKKK